MACGSPGGAGLDQTTRYRLARLILVLAGVLLFGILLGLLFWAKDPETAKGLGDYMAGLLPLIGAWVGALVAYYFSQEQQRESERTLRELLSMDGRLRTVPVTSWMIRPENMVSLSWSGDLDELSLEEILDKMEEGRVNRLPILDGAGRALAVVHRSVVDRYLAKQCLDTGQHDAAVSGLGRYSDLGSLLPRQTFIVLPENVTMADARNALLGRPGTADIIITVNGCKDEPVSGWLTNALIMEAGRL